MSGGYGFASPSLIIPNSIKNIGFKLASGTFSIVAADGEAHSATKVGRLVMPSTTAGEYVELAIDGGGNHENLFVDDVGSSDIVGEEFGNTSGTAIAQARPFFVYAVNADDTNANLAFAVSPNPFATVSPATANCGYHGNPASTPSDDNFFFLTSVDVTATHNAKPCVLIGMIRMTMSASDDWTVATLSATLDGVGKNFNIPKYEAGAYSNLYLGSAQTSVARDSVKLNVHGGAGYVWMPSVSTPGKLTLFQLTSAITLDLTGAHWGAGTAGNLTGRLLRTLLINDIGTLKFGVALLGGRQTILTTDTSATATDINLPEEVLCNSAIGNSANTVIEIGYVRADFNDTGDINTIQSGVNDVVTGKSADGIQQPWNPTLVGWSVNPTKVAATWIQYGRTIRAEYQTTLDTGTSDNTAHTITMPAKLRLASTSSASSGYCSDNSAAVTTPLGVRGTAGNATLALYKDHGGTAWTASGGSNLNLTVTFEVGPAASFID